MKVAYLFDSGSSFNIAGQPDCYVVPMPITVKYNGIETKYLDNVNIDRNNLSEIINSDATILTSQPNIGEIIALIEKLLNEYDLVISIPFSKHLSSTYNTVLSLQNEYDKTRFLVADANAMGITGNWLKNHIDDYLKSHSTINQEVINQLANKAKNNQCGGVIISDTKRLLIGGRVKSLKNLIIKTLKLKLIIKFKGNLEFTDKSISLKDAIDKLLKIIDNDCEFSKYGIKNCSIMADLNDHQVNKELLNYVLEKLSTHTKVDYSFLPGCVICHTGTNTFSILIESNRTN